MRIMLISQYAGSPSVGMAYRPHWLALEWQKLGHEVLIVAGDQSHLRLAHLAAGRSTVEGVKFITLRTLPYKANGPKRFANILSFRLQLYVNVRRFAAWRPDVVIASSTHNMDLRPSALIAHEAKATFVYEVHDLWPLTPRLLGGLSEKHPMIAWMQREEDFGCQHADAVVSILPLTKDYHVSRGMKPEIWSHVSNGVPEDTVDAMPPPRSHANGEPYVLGYFGSHGTSNDLRTLLATARDLHERGAPVEVHLTGQGEERDNLRQEAADLPNVYFHESVTSEVARRQMADCDFLYSGTYATELYNYGLSPNKLFEYMAAGRVIVQAGTPVWTPLSGEDFTVSVPSGDDEQLADRIEQIIAGDPHQVADLGEQAYQYVKNNATYSVLARRFLEGVPRATI